MSSSLARSGQITDEPSLVVAPLVLLVAGSRIVTAFTRLSAPGELFGTSYGVVLLAKTAALIGRAAIGWWHRRITLPALRAGHPRAFGRLAGAEVLIFAATIGLAVDLARTPTPPVSNEASASAGEVATVRPGMW